MKRILIVEDDKALREGIVLSLRDSEREFIESGTLAAARELLKTNSCDLVILDINLPDGSGLDFCREVRNQYHFPILFLTANDTEMDMVLGLEIGGDDYITKPFSLAVLRARVNVLLRRNLEDNFKLVMIDSFCFDFEKMVFSKFSKIIELSKTEQKLLYIFIQNKGLTLTRDKLISYVWSDGMEYVDENALSVVIRRLREKLEDNPSKPQYIQTIYGIGYTWAVK